MHHPKQPATGVPLNIGGRELNTVDFPVRIIVAGSRGWDDYRLLNDVISTVVSMLDQPVLFISGKAKSGADDLIIRWCEENEILCMECPADWDKHGKSAGYVRNAEMAEIGNRLIVFWDGVSKGTKHMIDIAKAKNIPTQIILIDSEATKPTKVKERDEGKKRMQYRGQQEALLFDW